MPSLPPTSNQSQESQKTMLKTSSIFTHATRKRSCYKQVCAVHVNSALAPMLIALQMTLWHFIFCMNNNHQTGNQVLTSSEGGCNEADMMRFPGEEIPSYISVRRSLSRLPVPWYSNTAKLYLDLVTHPLKQKTLFKKFGKRY